jgi:hypothetical protein
MYRGVSPFYFTCTKKNSLYSFLLSPLTFLVMFDRLSYSKYLFKYVILYVVFKLYLVIK